MLKKLIVLSSACLALILTGCGVIPKNDMYKNAPEPESGMSTIEQLSGDETTLTPDTTAVPETSAFFTIYNDTVWKDIDGNEIKAQGGCIYQSGETFHWFGPDFGPGDDYSFYAINHYTSTDLVNWKKEAPAAKKGDSIKLSGWVGRPWVLYNAPTQKYVMIFELSGSGNGVRNQLAFLTASSLYGPWSIDRSKIIQKLPDTDGTLYSLGDLGAFGDSDGNAYICYTFDKGQTNGAQCIIKLDPTTFTSVIPAGEGGVMAEFFDPVDKVREAASIVKAGDTYYYFTSRCSGWKSSETKYRTAKNIAGPWSDSKLVATSPKSSNSFNTQHDFMLSITGSSAPMYIYFGDRWSNHTGIGTGRYAWFPLTFDSDGVPTINGYSTWSVNIVTGEYNFQ